MYAREYRGRSHRRKSITRPDERSKSKKILRHVEQINDGSVRVYARVVSLVRVR